MQILIDTREQDYKHITKKLDAMGIQYHFKKLQFGDYSYSLDDISYENEIVIERKGSITEIIGNFTRNKKRFEAEFKRAKGCKVIVLIESHEADIDARRYRSSVTPAKVKSFIKTWQYVCGFEVVFVKKEDVAGYILKKFKDFKNEKNSGY